MDHLWRVCVCETRREIKKLRERMLYLSLTCITHSSSSSSLTSPSLSPPQCLLYSMCSLLQRSINICHRRCISSGFHWTSTNCNNDNNEEKTSK